jgi:hypothetical protein
MIYGEIVKSRENEPGKHVSDSVLWMFFCSIRIVFGLSLLI